jgi:hypothetical protein
MIAILLGPALACSRLDNSGRNTQRGGARESQERLSVRGCVQPAAGNTYVLRDITVVPPAEQPQGGARAPHAALQNGTFVRLGGASDELKQHLGQQVTVQGLLADNGQGTMGTTGVTDPGARAETKDAQANGATQPTVEAPVGALANGDAPLLAVEHVKAEGACGASTR